MDFKLFLDGIANSLGALTESQRAGFKTVVDEAIGRKTPLNRLAYILATCWWETAKAMQPVKEAFYVSSDPAVAEDWRRRKLHYYPYYGRGYVQLTWKANYKKASERYGQDFVAKPDGVLDPAIAVKILFDGMTEGWFTGKALDDYIDLIDESDDADLAQYIAARRIINGKDKDETIGKLALAFERELKNTGYGTAMLTATPLAGSSQFDSFIMGLGLRHFKPYEFLVKGSAHDNPASPAFGLNDDPPKSLWPNIAQTARVLDELRERVQRAVVMTSAYRSPAYNAAIGGARDSQHMHFRAIDFSVKGSPVGPSEWAQALRGIRSGGFFSGGIGVYSTFVHVDTRGQDVDWTG